MGGHGGLNILPQKRWNVYNYDNREKVRLDEEAAAREEQVKREQARKRDTEFRIEQLRTARGLAPLNQSKEPDESEPKSGHINLFEGIKIFDPVKILENEDGVERDGSKKKKMKMKKEDTGPKVVMPEDEKYRLGYGVAGKGVKLPWYLQKRNDDADHESAADDDGPLRRMKDEGNKSGKKTLEELREERFRREKREKERERALIREKIRGHRDASKDRREYRRGYQGK
ncbi:leukocyte receptor cluster member 1 [Quillaja saponaria]|uniref:Leukocyte receptor cluster member 1 n=1 Tax=Quillaja saponaria TaxID=32244 RepID=A0AAD7KNR7_QUISA|nr:leukocyte receptor cluster member 1 [Quillaja saponaria]